VFAAVSRSKFRLCGCEPQQIPPLEMLQFGDRWRNGGVAVVALMNTAR